MSYKKIQIPGVHIKWNNQIFPRYDKKISGSYVSQRRINKLKALAKKILEEERQRIQTVFMDYIRHRYKGRLMKVTFDIDGARERVENTYVCHDETLFGESDGEKIWIAKDKMSDAYLLGTLLHEALHYTVLINGQFMCEKEEHRVFRRLGDDC